MSFGDDTLDPSNRQCGADHVVMKLRCIGVDGHGGDHIDSQGKAWPQDVPGRLASRTSRPRQSPLALAAAVAGNVQMALEQLHELTTYELSSATVHRHRGTIEQLRKLLTEARNTMAGFALFTGKGTRMKARKKLVEGVVFDVEPLDFMVAEKVLLVHLSQTLAVIQGENTALILSDIEWNVLHKLIVDRLTVITQVDG